MSSTKERSQLFDRLLESSKGHAVFYTKIQSWSFKLIYAPYLKCNLWGEGSKWQWHAGVIWFCIFDICVWYSNLGSKLQQYVCKMIVLLQYLWRGATPETLSHMFWVESTKRVLSFCILECIEKTMRLCFYTDIWFSIQVHVPVQLDSKHLFLVFGALKMVPSVNSRSRGFWRA